MLEPSPRIDDTLTELREDMDVRRPTDGNEGSGRLSMVVSTSSMASSGSSDGLEIRLVL